MPCYQPAPDGLILTVRVTPNSTRDEILGVRTRDDGTEVLALCVRAVPDKGAANTATLKLIAESCGLAKSAVTLISGATARQKRLHLAGDTKRLIDHVNSL